jgi:hypothetical protein
MILPDGGSRVTCRDVWTTRRRKKVNCKKKFQQDDTLVRYFINSCKSLYMFRAKQSPIIRSSIKLYLQHLVLTNSVAGRRRGWVGTTSAEVKERVELCIYSSSGPSGRVLGWTLPVRLSILFRIGFFISICLNGFSHVTFIDIRVIFRAVLLVTRKFSTATPNPPLYKIQSQLNPTISLPTKSLRSCWSLYSGFTSRYFRCPRRKVAGSIPVMVIAFFH